MRLARWICRRLRPEGLQTEKDWRDFERSWDRMTGPVRRWPLPGSHDLRQLETGNPSVYDHPMG